MSYRGKSIEDRFKVDVHFIDENYIRKIKEEGFHDNFFESLRSKIRYSAERFLSDILKFVDYNEKGFFLSSGKKTKFYLNLKKFFVSEPLKFRELYELVFILGNVTEGTYIAGTGVSGTMIVSMFSDRYRPIIVRDDNDPKKEKVIWDGKAEEAYIVDDVVTTGKTATKVRLALEKKGIKPVGVLTLVNRALKEKIAGLPAAWLYTFRGDERHQEMSKALKKIWKILKEDGGWMTVDEIRRAADARGWRISNCMYPGEGIRTMLMGHIKQYGYPFECAVIDGRVKFRAID